MWLTCGKAIVCLSLIISIGGPWAILQTVAWASMAIDYAEELPFQEAIERAIDGQEPCDLCRFVAKASASGDESESYQANGKINLFFVREGRWLFHPTVDPELPSVLAMSHPTAFSPPIPPPRQV